MSGGRERAVRALRGAALQVPRHGSVHGASGGDGVVPPG